MIKRLTRMGNDLAIILDKALLDSAGIDENTPIGVAADDDVIVISPVRSEKLKTITEELDRDYGGVFKRLSE